ncbi:uncharacterized protein [Choristoneura fumiferana]|uniref:uncharacterized protein n=2 Tax=Choristoneura fumiferana TaxID=7141 RepID=UPI003D15C997
MEIGHSRLLKFLVKGDKMAEKHQLTIEVLTPTNIESDVPRQQKLRAPDSSVPEDVPMETNGTDVDNGEIKWSALRGLLEPVYVGEPERPPARVRRPDPEETGVTEDKNSTDEKKAKTRIPVSRFKTAVTKVQRERTDSEKSNESKKKEAPEKPSRRSSIPKLSDRILAARKNAYKTHNNEQTDKNDQEPKADVNNHQPTVKPVEEKPIKIDRIPIRRNVNRKIENLTRNQPTKRTESDENQTVTESNEGTSTKETVDQLDNEFDKLYDEIVDTEAESLPEEILSTKVKDPEKLESKFEEIVHQYDEETIEQVKVEPVDKARYSKIPLLKRRSEQEIKVPKQSERRLSLKTGLNKLAQTNSERQANDRKIKPSTPNDYNRYNNHEVETEKSVVFEDNTQVEVVNIDNDNLIEQQSPMPTPAYNIIATPDAELVKVGLSNFGIALERNSVPQNNNSDNDIATPELETVKVSVLEISNEANAFPVETDSENREIRMGYLVEEPVSIDAPQSIENVIVIDEPEAIEVSEVSLILNDDVVNEKTNEEEKIEESDSNDTIKVATIDFNEPNEKHPIIPDPVSEFKSVNLLRGTSGIEERTKSRYVNKPVKTELENKNKSVEEEIPIVKGKVSKILRRLTSQDDNELSSNNNVELNDDVPLKGNVSKIINRMTSQDTDHNVKKEFDEIPKKRSVLSRIAMFERPAQEPILPKIQPYKYSKPKRTISEEIRHSPKIVQEVLKPHIRNGNTDRPYELVSIDIMQPAEIVVNNEEQVLVVEELKEQTVVFENLDNLKLKEHISEPKEATILDDNITVIKNFNKNERVEFKPEEIDTNAPESQNLAEEETSNFEIIGVRPNVVDSHRSREAVKEYIPVKEKIKRLKSHEDSNLKRARSTAELDIGEAVKGKVKNMIVRMNSTDFLDDRDDILEEKEKISPKERPRMRSVSEKIAMFERILTPVKMDDVSLDAGRALNIDPNPKPKDSMNTVNSVSLPTKAHQPTEAATTPETDSALEQSYNDKIRELLNAKLTHGSVTNMSYVQLRDGHKMPVLALGTALLDPRLAKHIVASAIDLGFRAIDTAFIYGTEKEVGEGIRAKIQDGTVKREELFIMSKLWSTFHKPELVEPACRASLAALGLEYFDLFMIHNPMSFKEGNDPLPKIANVLQFSSYEYLDAWFAMEGLVSKGLVRSVGVSNFNSEQVARVVEKGRLKPVVDQVECHPYMSQQRLSEFCDARDVRLSCFGTLGSKGTPAELKASQAAAIDDPLVQVMAAGLGITPAQLLIRYQIECGHNVVVKASSAAHQWDVLRALGASLAPAQVAALHALNGNKRAFTFKGMGDTHRNYPFKIPF